MPSSIPPSTLEPPSTRRPLRVSVLLEALAKHFHRVVHRYASAKAAGPSTDGPVADQPTANEHSADHADASDQPAHPTIGEIVDRTAHAGFGFFVGFLALVSIPFVGLSTLFGGGIAFGAIQMILGRDRPWLPKRLRRIHVSPKMLNGLSARVARWTHCLELIVRPRFVFLTRGPFWSLCGLCILSQALSMALPLPIPGSNVVFVVTIMLYAIGLLESDGLLIMLAHALIAIQVMLTILCWDLVMSGLRQGLAWMGS